MSRAPARIAAAVATSLLIGLSVQPTASHAAPPPLRILLEGDSITQGFDGDFTWRYRFFQELTRQHVGFDFVGSRSGPYVKPGYTTSQYADPHFDTDHFAQAGSPFSYHLARIQDEISTQHPDVVVLALGVNDLRFGQSPANTDTRLRRWISEAREADPDLSIIVSPVLDATDTTRPGLAQEIRDLRALQAATVSELSTTQSPIHLADTERGWTVTGDTYDNLHPNATGETLIAQRIAETFHSLGYLPQAPDIYRPTVWSRVARAQVHLTGRRAVLTWDQQALTGIRLQIHRVGARKNDVYQGFFGGGRMTTAPLREGQSYDFRVQFVRMRTETPFGPWVRVHVPATAPAPVARVVVDERGVHWSRSEDATRYVVSYRRLTGHWLVRRTKHLSVLAKGVRAARVRAVNANGSSPTRLGSR